MYLVYLPWFWAHGGQTPGMKVMHVRVVRENDGGPLSVGQAFLRLVGFWVSSAVFYLGLHLDPVRRPPPGLARQDRRHRRHRGPLTVTTGSASPVAIAARRSPDYRYRAEIVVGV